MAYTSSILIISAEPVYQQELAAELKSLGARAVLCESVGEARGLLKRERFDLAFCTSPECAFRIDAREGGAGEMRIPIVMVSRMDDWTNYLKAMSAGAFDYIVTPLQAGEVGRVLKAAVGTSASASGVVARGPGDRIRRKQIVSRGEKKGPVKKTGFTRKGSDRTPGSEA